MAPLEALGFALAGYGCTTCIGNSGPLDDAVAGGDRGERPRRRRRPVGQPQLRGPDPPARARELPRLAAAGRRLRAGRPGRHRPDDGAARAPDVDGRPVFLADIWPAPDEIRTVIGDVASTRSCSGGRTRRCSRATTAGGRCRSRRATATPGTPTRPTSPSRRSSTASRRDAGAGPDIVGLRVLAVLGDSVTTDHISPGRLDRPVVAGRPVAPGARRRTARVQLVRRPARPPRGDDARHVRQHPAAQPAGRRARRARTRSTCPTASRASSTTPRCATRPRASPLAILAGREYGSGSSRDWAAKGPALLGVRVVLAESYERIHRSNLVGMGILPLQFEPGDTAASLGLTGRETLLGRGLGGRADAAPDGDGHGARGRRHASAGSTAIARLDGPIDVEYYRPAGSCRRSSGGSPPRRLGRVPPTDTKKPPGEEPGASTRRSGLSSVVTRSLACP